MLARRAPPAGLRRLLVAERWMSAVNRVYVLGLIVVMVVLVPRHELLAGCPYGLPRAIYLVQIIPFFSIALAEIVFWRCIGLWREAAVGWWSRCYHLGIVLCGAGFVAFLGYWKHIGYMF